MSQAAVRSRTTMLPRPFLDFLTKRRKQKAPDVAGNRAVRMSDETSGQHESWRLEAASKIRTGDISTFKSDDINIKEQRLVLWETHTNVPHEKIHFFVPKHIYDKAFNPEFGIQFGQSAVDLWFERSLLGSVFYLLGEDLALGTSAVASSEDIISGSLEEIKKKIKALIETDSSNKIYIDKVASLETRISILKDFFPGIDEGDPKIIVQEIEADLKKLITELMKDAKIPKKIKDDAEMLEYVIQAGGHTVASLTGIRTTNLGGIKETLESILAKEQKYIEQFFLPDEDGRRLLKEEIFGKGNERFNFLLEETDEPNDNTITTKIAFFIFLGIKNSQQFELSLSNEEVYAHLMRMNNKERVHFLLQQIRITKAPNIARGYVKDFVETAGTSQKRDEMRNLLDTAITSLRFLPYEESARYIITMVRKYCSEHKDPKIKGAFGELSKTGIRITDYIRLGMLAEIESKKENINTKLSEYAERLDQIEKMEAEDEKYFQFLQFLVAWTVMNHPSTAYASTVKTILDSEYSIRQGQPATKEHVKQIVKSFVKLKDNALTNDVNSKFEKQDRDYMLTYLSNLLETLMLQNDFRLGNLSDDIIHEIMFPPKELQESFKGNKAFLYDFIKYKKQEKTFVDKKERLVDELATIEQKVSYAKKNTRLFTSTLEWTTQQVPSLPQEAREHITGLAIALSLKAETFKSIYDFYIKTLIQFFTGCWTEMKIDDNKKIEFIDDQATTLEQIISYSLLNKALLSTAPAQFLAMVLINRLGPLVTELYERLFYYDPNSAERNSANFNLVGQLIAKGYDQLLFGGTGTDIIPAKDVFPIDTFIPISLTLYLSKIYSTYLREVEEV